MKHATGYYKSPFSPSNRNSFELDPDLWSNDENVNNKDNWNLTKPFEEKEIKNALFQMEKNKAVGPDQIPIEFFQSCWNNVKKDIMKMFNDFLLGCI